MGKMRFTSEKTGQHTRLKVLGRVRKERMAAPVKAQGFLSNADLAVEFWVSEMTIRRDLAELEAEGTINRTHGGAIIEESKAGLVSFREPYFDERSGLNGNVKAHIASANREACRRQSINCS
jgi:DeoR/GlpR family transcriptional regulator of sugar metabolism